MPQSSEPSIIIQYIAENVNEAVHKLRARPSNCFREYDADTHLDDVNNGHRKFAQILTQKGATELSLLFIIC